MKTRIRIIVVSSLLLIMGSLAVLGITYGWIALGTGYTSNVINVGDLRYTLSGSFITDDTTIVPNDELVNNAFTINNQSPIDSQLRLKITYTRITNAGGIPIPETDYVFKNDSEDHLAVNFTSTFTFSDGDAIPDEHDDDYWYYITPDNVILAASGSIPLLDSLYYDGNETSIDYNQQDIAVKITIEVKQSGNVTWEELATYDFATGYPAS